jgi:hypothetical protein
MKQFDIDDKSQTPIQLDATGREIKVGDIVLKAYSSTEIVKAVVIKVCKQVVKLEVISFEAGKRTWSLQSWGSALYILERNEKNNI